MPPLGMVVGFVVVWVIVSWIVVGLAVDNVVLAVAGIVDGELVGESRSI